MIKFPQLYGLEYFIVPLVALPFFKVYQELDWAGTLACGFIVTFLNAIAALYRSKQLSQMVGGMQAHSRFRRVKTYRMEPVWVAFAGMTLLFLSVLQLILSVTHLSYYRTKDLQLEVFGGSY